MRKTVSILLALALVLGCFSFAFADQTYVVKSGDVLWEIAQKYGTTYQKLAEYNGIPNPHLIFPVFCKRNFLTFAKIFPQAPVGKFYVNPSNFSSKISYV